MARPLEPLTEEKIQEYEDQLIAAKEKNDKYSIKKYKHYFLEYINKRGFTIEDFKECSIYQYFKPREKRVDALMQEIKEIEKTEIGYELPYFYKSMHKKYELWNTVPQNNYFSRKDWWESIEKEINPFWKIGHNYKEIERIMSKKDYMRKLREKRKRENS
jgi:hypothetical protein